MKRTLLIFASAIVIFFTACNKDGIKLKPHDQDEMMMIMHQMMDSMTAMQPTNDPDIDFASMMIIHHQGAINMANYELQNGSNDSLKRTAQKIITEQQTEIDQMRSILAGLTVNDNDPAFTMEQMNNMTKMDAEADEQLITGNTDNDFATLMIVHHQSAIDNADAYLHHGNDDKLIPMAHDMVNSQTMEINELGNWLKANKR